MTAGFSIEGARDIPSNDPLLFYLPIARASLVQDVDPMPGGVRIGAINMVTLHLPETTSLSPALDALVDAGVLGIDPGREFLIDLYHDGESREIIDLRPELPLRFMPCRTTSTPG